jgi:PAS domain S-box-containing protein
MLAGLLLLEALSIGLFATLMIQHLARDIDMRAQHRLAYQASAMSLQAQEAMQRDQPGWVGLSVKMMGESASVANARITDPTGKVLFASQSDPEKITLDPSELAQIPLVRHEEPRVFALPGDRWECVKVIYVHGRLLGYAWVAANRAWDHEQLNPILDGTIIFGTVWVAVSALLVLLVARSISRPLEILHRGTRALMDSPENSGSFPLPDNVHSEFGELIDAFNRMVASIEEQRSGLNDTLSLLDSMLANAPIGLAFLDRRCRFVRVNQVFADMAGVSLSRHLGRTLPELLPQPVASEVEEMVLRVFAEQEPVRNLELNGESGKPSRPWTWLASAYPVRTDPRKVRWVGVIVLDASDRKRSEEALRKTEKLAAAGRLAASIAHEINNPLSAVTNLLYLLRNFCELREPALNYVTMAENEVSRIAEITRQTLRFYRQSTLPSRARMSEILDSVLSLYHGRICALDIQVERDYDTELDLFCFAGEIRQVFANLVSNSIDASSASGRLMVRARRSQNWNCPAQTGVRFTVADTGAGMTPAVRERVFEAFFTTKEVTGTGLGMWVSHEIIVKHGGLVHVRSRVAANGLPDLEGPSGTVFQIFIPDGTSLADVVPEPVAATG